MQLGKSKTANVFRVSKVEKYIYESELCVYFYAAMLGRLFVEGQFSMLSALVGSMRGMELVQKQLKEEIQVVEFLRYICTELNQRDQTGVCLEILAAHSQISATDGHFLKAHLLLKAGRL